MKCVYTFRVRSHLKLSHTSPIPLGSTLYELIADSQGVLASVRATISLPNQSNWPQWHGESPKTLRINDSLQLVIIQQQLRMVQGILSFVGIERIDVQNPEIEWHPDNDEERKALGINRFKYSRGKPDFSDAEPTEFDIIARAFFVAQIELSLEKPLNFYRHGCTHMAEEEYIDAIYDLYYALELLFANGHSKKTKVIAEFLKSSELKEAVFRTLKDPDSLIRDCPNYSNRFAECLGGDPSNVYKFIVDLRGTLHHQNSGSPHIWHPDDQIKYRCEALFIQRLCYHVLFPKMMSAIYSEPIIKHYQAIFIKKDNSQLPPVG